MHLRLAAIGRLARLIIPVTLATSVVVACESPTLPLPPPETPELTAGTDADHVKLTSGCGGAESGAEILILNTNTAVPGDESLTGSIASACGAWDATVYAHRGDLLDITQQYAAQTSTETTLLVNY